MWSGESAPTQKFCTKVLCTETKQPPALQAKPLAELSKHTMASSLSFKQQLLPSCSLRKSQEAQESDFHSRFSRLPMGTCSLPEASLGGCLLGEQTWLPGQATFRCGVYFPIVCEQLEGKTEKVDFIFEVDVMILCKKRRKEEPLAVLPSLTTTQAKVNLLFESQALVSEISGRGGFAGRTRRHPSGDCLFSLTLPALTV